MHTSTRLHCISRPLLVCFLFIAYALALPSFVGNPHSGYSADELRNALDLLPEEHLTLMKRQLGHLLDGLLGGPKDAAGAQGSPLGVLGGLGGLGGLSGLGGLGILGPGEVEWPLDVDDKYRFIPPEPGSQRGVCIGLNAMANHGLIERTGIVSLYQVLWAAQVMGMGFDTALVTVLIPVIFAGDPTTLTFSIGGPDPRVNAPFGGLLGLVGQPQGLSYSVQIIDQPASSTRNDVEVTGDPVTLDIQLYMELSSLVPAGGRFTFAEYAYWGALRYYQSIHTNPNFYCGPGTCFLFRTVVFALPVRLLANQTGRYAEGELTHEILDSFYGITHYPEPWTYNRGCERIPRGWLGLRSIGSSWPALQAVTDALYLCELYEILCSFGGNVDGVDTFVGLRLDDPESGLADLGLLANPTNLLCFVLHIVGTGMPSWTNNIFATLFGMLSTTVASLGCPPVPELTRGGVPLQESLRQQFPGARRSPV